MSMPHDTTAQRGAVLFDPDAAWVPLGKFVGAVVLVASAAVWCYRVDMRLGAIEQGLAGMHETRWTTSDMEHWADLVQAQNPTLTIPRPRHRNGDD